MSILNYCNCLPTHVQPPTPPKNPCEGCLVVPSLYYGCALNITPLTSITIDTKDFNDLSECKNCQPTYAVVGYDTDIFQSVSIDTDGVFSIITADPVNRVPERNFGKILYFVNCPCTGIRVYANIEICVSDFCFGVVCPEGFACGFENGVCTDCSLDVADFDDVLPPYSGDLTTEPINILLRDVLDGGGDTFLPTGTLITITNDNVEYEPSLIVNTVDRTVVTVDLTQSNTSEVYTVTIEKPNGCIYNLDFNYIP